jgi:hypothetical protein
MPTYHDADLILRLYDLRRESVMRKARAWFIAWTPASAEEAKSIGADMSVPENAYVRQVTSFWEMASSLANAGTVDADLYAKNSGESVLLASKCQFLKAKFPGAWTRTMPETEAFIAGNAIAQKKAEMFKARFV